MRITHIKSEASSIGVRHSAMVHWEETGWPTNELSFSIDDQPAGMCEANAFLAGLYPLAVLHGERRIEMAEPVCPMLVDGLATIHAWWRSWGLADGEAPVVEAPAEHRAVEGSTTATVFLSGGVDSVHMLLLNRRRFSPGDPGYARDAVFLHGFDIGKHKKTGPATSYFGLALDHVRPIATELGVRLVTASTDLRHLPTAEGFWSKQFHGACLAAAAHAVTRGPSLVLIAATFDVANMSTWGSHPIVDPNYSTQRVRIVHECARYSRLQKVRDLAAFDVALDHLRVCQTNPEDRLNCGKCEKCLRTRLELFVAGVPFAGALGDTLPDVALVAAQVEVHDRYTASCYRDLAAPLRALQQTSLADVLAEKVTNFERATPVATG